MNPLAFDFMQRALVAAVLVGLVAPAVGVFLVQRRLALMGDGLGHVALTGVALGFLLGTAPVLTAVVVATIGAVVIELVRQQGRTGGDVALALLFYGGIAGGVLLIGLTPGGTNANLLAYLFGSLTAVSPGDVVVIVAFSVALLGRPGGRRPAAVRRLPRRGVRAGGRSAGPRPEPAAGRAWPR